MNLKTLYRKGFTLIELMVVVAIIGVLMSAGILAFTNAQQNARDSKRRADIDAIGKAMEQYYQNNTAYPANTTLLGTYFPNGAVPVDPQGAAYNVTFGGTGNWCACATMEKTTRGNATANAGGACTYAATGTLFCTSRRQ